MEGLLRGQEIPEVTFPDTDFYDLQKPVLFFPVRHHSPACAFHLNRAIEEYQPDCILIEGPENAGHLIPVLTDEATKAPIAVYYAYRDSSGYINEEKADYKCYYPFLDCSPELVALRQAKKLGIPGEFIDLPYARILIGTEQDKGLRRETEKQTYNDDYLLSRSKYLQMLCERTGLRDFEELWEKYFEIQGLYEDTRTFVRHLRTYCDLTRQHTPPAEMAADGCLLRERYMAWRISEASLKYRKILVVTGGFHTQGLIDLLKVGQEGQTVAFLGEAVRQSVIPETDQGVYPMAYSMEAADALNGYASGMQSPGFYQKVWEGVSKGTTPKKIYDEVVLGYLTRTGKRARKQDDMVTSFDEICAYSMARQLAALRGKAEPGIYELRDSVLSSFVKGECNLSTDGPLRILRELTCGRTVGALCASAQQPPLLQDFEALCRKYGLKIHTTLEYEVTLELFKKERHLQISRFFYRLEFLGTKFCILSKGADLLRRRDQNRIREIWKYHWSGQVTAALIDASVAGGTVAEASGSLWKKRFASADTCRDAAKLMVQGFLMGQTDQQKQIQEHMKAVLAADGDFFSLAGGFSHIVMLYELKDLYRVDEALHLEELAGACFQKVVQLLPSMAMVQEEQLQECLESCLSLYQMSGRRAFIEYRPLLLEGFESLLEAKSVRPGLEGAVMGLLYGSDSSYGEGIKTAFGGYVGGTPDYVKKASGFLRGLFFTARDFVFVSPNFLEMIDELLGRLPGDEFMELLPELRMAFGYFTPIETDRIARKAAVLHGKSKKQLLNARMVSPIEYTYGEELDRYAREQMQEVERI